MSSTTATPPPPAKRYEPSSPPAKLTGYVHLIIQSDEQSPTQKKRTIAKALMTVTDQFSTKKTTIFNMSKHICKYFDVPCPTIVEVISISDVDEGVICKSLKLVQDPEVITV